MLRQDRPTHVHLDLNRKYSRKAIVMMMMMTMTMDVVMRILIPITVVIVTLIRTVVVMIPTVVMWAVLGKSQSQRQGLEFRMHRVCFWV